MQQIVTCEPWTTTSSHAHTRTKTGDGPSTPQFIFKPYYVWITSLLCGAVGRV
jgi:hypothetical protein